jgi:hypothetical protein
VLPGPACPSSPGEEGPAHGRGEDWSGGEENRETKKGTLVIDSFVPSCEDIFPNWLTKTAQFHKKKLLVKLFFKKNTLVKLSYTKGGINVLQACSTYTREDYIYERNFWISGCTCKEIN